MSVLTNINSQVKANRGISKSNILKYLAAVLVCLVIAVAALPSASLAADKVTLLTPAKNATNVNDTNVVLTWQKVSDNVTYYMVNVAIDASFSGDGFVKEYVDSPAVTYTITKKMAFGTKYYWRVTAVLTGDVIGDPSETWSFTVRSENTPAQTTAAATTAAATTTAGATTKATSGSNNSSGGDGIMGFIDEIGWPLTLGMVGVVVIFIILLSILLTKPKKGPAGMGQGPAGGMGGMGGRMGGPQQQQRSQRGGTIQCPTCGFMNTPDRKFCANCGTTMVGSQQFQAPPPPQQPYQGMGYQAENQAPPFRPPQPPPYQGQGFQGQQFQQPPYQGQPYGQPFGQQFGQGPARMQQQGIVCYNCGTPNPPGRQFCGGCGATLVQPQQQQQQQQQRFGQQFQPPVFCPNCGAPAQPGQQWCGNCGGNIPVGGQQHVVGTYQSFSCPICGANINRGLNPCPSCGTWLDWGR
jgi:hypothetical protein